MITLQDPTFPGLTSALDVEGIRDQLRDALPECRAGLDLEKVKIYDVQYQPGKRCVILYSVKFRDRETLSSERQLVSAVLLPDSTPPRLPSDDLIARYRASGDRPLRDPVIHLPRIGLVAYAFPLDPRMPGLVDAFDADTMKVKLGRMWKRRAVRVKRVTAQPLSYTPGARVAMMCEVLSELRADQMPELRHLVGKIDVQRHAADLFARHWAVWKESAQRVALAPPVGFIPDLNLFFQERIEGVRLAEIAGTGSFISPVRKTAKAAADLHSMDLPLPHRRPFAQKVKAVHRWGSMLAAIRPQERPRIEALRDRLASELERHARVTGPVHGDLHASNILVKDNRVFVIDLDNMTLGDRLLDVGRFLSGLRTSSLRVSGTVNALADAGESFLERYLSLTGEDERRARLFEACSLMITAGTGFRLQREGWEETARMLIDEVDRTLQLATGPATPGRSEAVVVDDDEALDVRRRRVQDTWARDGQYVRAVLDPRVRELYGAEIVDCVVEHKKQSAKRELLRYRLSGWRNDEPWKLSLEGILWRRRSGRRVTRRMTKAHEILERSDEALRIPRPVAYVREIHLQVLDVPHGRSLLSLLDGDDAEDAVERLARALAALHATSIPLDRSRSVDEELESLQSRVERLGNDRAGSSAPRMMRAVSEAISEGPDEVGPVVRHLSLRRLLFADGRVALADVDDVVLSHPFLDAADLLGRLELWGLMRKRTEDCKRLAARFRQSYLTSAQDVRRLGAFEAAALLRLVCGESDRRRQDGLLDAAENRLGPGYAESTT